MPTYNTIMSLATGAALCSLAYMAKSLHKRKHVSPEGWSINLGVLGIILFPTGLHMTLTWPLAKYFPYDNIVFGEPVLAIGAIVLGLSFYFWRRAEQIKSHPQPLMEVASVMMHFKYLFIGLGLAMIATGIAGVKYELFAAPKEEPITGLLHNYPMIEASFISALWAITGVGSILAALVLKDFAGGNTDLTTKHKFTYLTVYGTGLVFLLFGAFNYFTHIGLIVNTMK